MVVQLISGLLPAHVIVVETFSDPPTIEMYPDEFEFVARAIEIRRREFATVRNCARLALTQLGVSPGPILPGANGAPQWPVGIVGSMTHCEGFRAAAIARRETVVSLGIDAELHAPLPANTLNRVALPRERSALVRLSESHPDVAWDRLLFSAKESVFKAWFPLAGRWLNFSDCEISFESVFGNFTASLIIPGPLVNGERINEFQGRWKVLHANGVSHVATAVLVASTK